MHVDVLDVRWNRRATCCRLYAVDASIFCSQKCTHTNLKNEKALRKFIRISNVHKLDLRQSLSYAFTIPIANTNSCANWCFTQGVDIVCAFHCSSS